MRDFKFAVGVDLGQACDYTAIAIVEPVDAYHLSGTPKDVEIHVRHLERIPLGTAYPDIVSHVGQLRARLGWVSEAVVDSTGVGRPIVDLFRKGSAQIQAVTITGGREPSMTRVRGGEDWNLPKADLIGGLLTLLHTKRLKFAKDLPMTQVLIDELLNFEVKLTSSANETYNARNGAHDDLVLAVALACWHAMKPPRRRVQWRNLPSWM